MIVAIRTFRFSRREIRAPDDRRSHQQHEAIDTFQNKVAEEARGARAVVENSRTPRPRRRYISVCTSSWYQPCPGLSPERLRTKSAVPLPLATRTAVVVTVKEGVDGSTAANKRGHDFQVLSYRSTSTARVCTMIRAATACSRPRVCAAFHVTPMNSTEHARSERGNASSKQTLRIGRSNAAAYA